MKRQTMFFGILVFFVLLVWVLPQASAQNYGQIRALKRRADTVTQQKNSFVARVLSSYKIPCQITEQGIVARLHIENRWYDVNQIEIVPVTREVDEGYQVIAHEIFSNQNPLVPHLSFESMAQSASSSRLESHYHRIISQLSYVFCPLPTAHFLSLFSTAGSSK